MNPLNRTLFGALLALAISGCATTSSSGGVGLPSGGLPGGSPDRGTGSAGGLPSIPSSTGTGAPGTTGVPSTPSTSGSASKPAAPASGSGSATPEPATTPDERKEVLEKKLDESLGTFDKTLKGEQDRVANERDSRAATGGGSASGDGTPGSGGEAAAGTRAGDLKSESSTAAGTAKNDAATGSSGTGSGSGDKGVAQGSDDDIVARRLRRAAEQETDPELKEKLWKEYYEYKRNGQGKS